MSIRSFIRKTDWLHWIILSLSLIGFGFFVLAALGMAGCQSSTSIQGGSSEAKAVREEIRPRSTTSTTIEIVLPKEAK